MDDLRSLRRKERTTFLATLRKVGPDAASLCSGWQAADIAAHVAMAERYGGVPMTLLYPLRRILPAGARSRLMARLRRIGDRQTTAMKHRGWSECLQRLESGPPAAYDLSGIAPIRLVEEWVHHEDVRRANGSGPRPADPAVDEALWQSLTFLRAFSEFSAPLESVEVALLDGRSLRVRPEPAELQITAPPGELLLFLAGRHEVAQVQIAGDAGMLAHLKATLSV